MAKISQGSKLKVRSGISVKLRQSIELLPLNQIELGDFIRKELQENPFLEEKALDEDASEKETFDDYFESPDIIRSSNESENFIEETISPVDSLLEVVNPQLRLMEIPQTLQRLLLRILTSLNEHGLTLESHIIIAENEGYSLLELRKAIEILKNLEPTGVGAEDVWQSLEWQAEKRYPDNDNLLMLISLLKGASENIESLHEEIIQKLTVPMRLSVAEIKKLITCLRSLNVYPASMFQNYNETITPDVIYSRKEGRMELRLYSRAIPELIINEDLFQQLGTDNKSNEWRDLYYTACNVVNGISFRNSSLLKVASAILNMQSSFFKYGPEYVRPLSLADMAEIVKLHVSSVSRLTKNKYCLSPFGVFPLKFFFPKKLKSSEGKTFGVVDLEKAIERIIRSEDLNFPLSDARISTILQAEGYKIQRRTVAKYRKLLHIPTQIERKVDIKSGE